MHDIIIIGAGFAGVTAARELSAAGLRSLIIEGWDRIGGRIWRDEHREHPFELGGAYVHWSQPHIWSEITRYYPQSLAPGAQHGQPQDQVLPRCTR